MLQQKYILWYAFRQRPPALSAATAWQAQRFIRPQDVADAAMLLRVWPWAAPSARPAGPARRSSATGVSGAPTSAPCCPSRPATRPPRSPRWRRTTAPSTPRCRTGRCRPPSTMRRTTPHVTTWPRRSPATRRRPPCPARATWRPWATAPRRAASCWASARAASASPCRCRPCATQPSWARQGAASQTCCACSSPSCWPSGRGSPWLIRTTPPTTPTGSDCAHWPQSSSRSWPGWMRGERRGVGGGRRLP